MYKLRKASSIPIYIEEDHNDVLQHIFKFVGAKYLPIEKNVLIHFDSHPDLLIPHSLKDYEVQDKHLLFDRLSIENWILPACYLGIIDTILWICPPWANQISPGEHVFKIGREIDTCNIRVTSTETYFISESITCRPNELENTKDILLIVYKIESTINEENKLLQSLKHVLQSRETCILDIDLDFFSTQNPFIGLYSKIDLYERLKKIYTFDAPQSDECTSESAKLEMAMQSCFKRKQTINKLQDITSYVQKHEEINSYDGIGIEFVKIINSIKEDIKKMYGPNEIIDWGIIHNAGCTCDDTELPHHISSKSEIKGLIQDMQAFLSYILETKSSNITYPTIVTIARSSLDDYCPTNQVDAIQKSVEDALQRSFGNRSELQFHREYLDND